MLVVFRLSAFAFRKVTEMAFLAHMFGRTHT